MAVLLLVDLKNMDGSYKTQGILAGLLSASTCSGFVALEPVYAILFAYLFFHEPISLMIGVSAFMIVGSSLTLLFLEKESSSN